MYLLVEVLLSNLQLAITEDEVSVSVSRRLSGDLYKNFNSSVYYTCQGDNLTFLVSERMCVKNQELIDGMRYLDTVTACSTTKNDENHVIIFSDCSADCDFAITPKRMPLNCQIVLTIDHRNQTTFVTAKAFNSTLVDALVTVANSTNSCQPATSPFCYISSLEVYRGREEAINNIISHEGFSLSDKGTIQVKK